MSSGMRFKGLVGAMDCAAALDALARGVAAGEIRAPFGEEPLLLGEPVRLSFKASGKKGKGKVSLKLRPAKPCAASGEAPAPEEPDGAEAPEAFPPLRVGEAPLCAMVGPLAEVPGEADEDADEGACRCDAPRFTLKAKGEAPAEAVASLLHGLAVGLASGGLELGSGEESVALAPGAVLKFALKGRHGGLGVKISWKPKMKGEPEPLPPLFTEPGELDEGGAPSDGTSDGAAEGVGGAASGAPSETSPSSASAGDSAPAASCCRAARPEADTARSAGPAAGPAERLGARLDAPEATPAAAQKPAAAPEAAKAATDKSAPSKTATGAATSDEAVAPVPLPPEAGIPAPDAVANIVAATAGLPAPAKPAAPAGKPAAAPKAPPKPPARPAGKAPAKAAKAAPAKTAPAKTGPAKKG